MERFETAGLFYSVFYFSLAPSLLLFFTFLLFISSCTRPPDNTPPEGMAYIPQGAFIMGSDEVDEEAEALRFGSKPWFLNEAPKRKVVVKAFFIDKYEVSNKKYKEFVDATGHRPPKYWKGSVYPAGWDDIPVIFVNWFSADSYCKWRRKRLPTEAEWEKTARGTDGRRFPWGNEFDPNKTNAQGKFGGPVAVGSFEEGKSPFGVYDMAGNVAEWTEDWYMSYPGSDYEDEDYGKKFKVVRGGGWGGIAHYNLNIYRRTAHRFYAPPANTFGDIGLRCVMSSK